MKKLLIGLAVVAFAFTLTSCNKTCQCTYKIGSLSYEYETDRPEGGKCSDIGSLEINGTVIDTGVECK
ncbi:MAG: hypothetical protein LBP67_06880 [Bacteroidales bacterium]|jgi:hypothetical protein|nr:hypothetical protein [Bacteroidales bacterium]